MNKQVCIFNEKDERVVFECNIINNDSPWHTAHNYFDKHLERLKLNQNITRALKFRVFFVGGEMPTPCYMDFEVDFNDKVFDITCNGELYEQRTMPFQIKDLNECPIEISWEESPFSNEI